MNPNNRSTVTRRQFSGAGVSALVGSELIPTSLYADDKEPAARQHSDLSQTIGIVSASANAQTSGRANGRNFTLLEMPKILSEELDMTVLDLNTMSFPSFSKVTAAYLEKLRNAADKAGCVLTNLKMNQRNLQINSPDREIRIRSIAEYKRSIDIASELGCRWARPLPRNEMPDRNLHVDSYRELCDYAADHGVQLLVENFGWMQSDPNSVAQLVKDIGHNVAACPDTGNWNNNEVRYEGLKRTFPLAVTCDFKAKQLGADGAHPAYDLKHCFDIAWDAGFRGPWAIEHGNADTTKFLRGIQQVRDMLRKWTAERLSAASDKRGTN